MQPTTRHPAEDETLKAFVASPKRDRLLFLLGSPKRRAQGLDALNHFPHWDPRFALPVDPSADVLARLRLLGAPSDCHVVSNSSELDGRDMPLAQAVDACENDPFASILCCLPGELAFFFDEAAAPRIRILLSRPRNFREPGAPATRRNWKILPPPTEREHFQIPVLYSDADGERMRQGFVPQAMEERWFIYFEQGWLYFHRGWTGHCIFGVQLDGFPGGVRVIDAWVSRDKSQYNSQGLENDQKLVTDLIRTKLLSPPP